MRSLAVAGIGLGAINAEFDAEAKKKRKKKCKKPKPITLQTEIVACPGPSTTEFTGSRRFAQTFSATQTGVVTTASVEFTEVPGGSDFAVEIRTVDGNGVPTAEVLASAAAIDLPPINAPFALTVPSIRRPVSCKGKRTRWSSPARPFPTATTSERAPTTRVPGRCLPTRWQSANSPQSQELP